MDWNGNIVRVPNFVNSRPPENSFSYLYNYNYNAQFRDIIKPQTSIMPEHQEMLQTSSYMEERNIMSSNNYGLDPKKSKRLSMDQLDSLENSFQEDIKLEPDRKMKLAKELGLQPRQIAVWFQNRRARWKTKQLERLYDALKQEYDTVSREKHKLQQEVMALKAMLKDQVAKKQLVSTTGGYNNNNNTDQVVGVVSGTEETVESTSIPSSDNTNNNNNVNQIADHCNYVDDDYNPLMIMPPAYWASLPSCP
ncbi:hypothetical protein ACJIZ3_024333 [Penstemon smallii]|uniref:Homeobox-leucine zipper protein n=1 Tax=Penstemon smallii TaxID=265156 RepID=A0ABD3TSG2_9LAMI